MIYSFVYKPTGELVTPPENTSTFQGSLSNEYRLYMEDPNEPTNWRLDGDLVDICFKRPDGAKFSYAMTPHEDGYWYFTSVLSEGWETNVDVSESGQILKVSFYMRRPSTDSPTTYLIKRPTEISDDIVIYPTIGYIVLNLVPDQEESIRTAIAALQERIGDNKSDIADLKADKQDKLVPALITDTNLDGDVSTAILESIAIAEAADAAAAQAIINAETAQGHAEDAQAAAEEAAEDAEAALAQVADKVSTTDLSTAITNATNGLLYNGAYDSTTHVITFSVKGSETPFSINLPIESLISNISLNEDNELVLTFEDETTVAIDLSVLLTGVVKSVNGNTPDLNGAVTIPKAVPTGTGQTDGLMTHEDKAKLDGQEAGAQSNVKPDWNAASGNVAEILNKPTIPTVPSFASQSEAETGTEETKAMNPLRTKQAIIKNQNYRIFNSISERNAITPYQGLKAFVIGSVDSDVQVGDILNVVTWATTDWVFNIETGTQLIIDFTNGYSIITVTAVGYSASIEYRDDTNTLITTLGTCTDTRTNPITWAASSYDFEGVEVDSITVAGVGDAIKTTVDTSTEYQYNGTEWVEILIPASQIQSDWNQASTGALDYIKNKPTIPTVPTISTDISADAASDVKTASSKAVKTYVDGILGDIETLLEAL